MNKADPIELQKAKEIADILIRSGIDFVAIPVTSDKSKHELLTTQQRILNKILEDVENKESD